MNNRVKKSTLLLYCLFGGWFGLHHFVRRRYGMGILYLCTFGLFYIGWFIDTLIIIFSDPKSEVFNKNISNSHKYDNIEKNHNWTEFQKNMDRQKQKNIENNNINLSHRKCPVCGEILDEFNRSIAKFNGYTLCISCEIIISEHYGNQKDKNHIYLEDLQEIVSNYTDTRFINSVEYYENEVPYEVYKYAYSDNKAKSYPKDYIVFDTETTGLEPSIDRIIEISAIKYINGEEVDTFSQLINPEQDISSFITKLTGIKNKDLRDKPTIKEILPKFFEFIEDYTLVAHNTPYDIKMIACECYRSDIEMCNNRLIDTVPLAKRMFDKEEVGNFKLSNLKEYYGINIISHRATEDCQMCNIIYQSYLKYEKIKSNNKKVLKIDNNISIIDENTGEIIEV